jgi:hypothetical protein
MMQDCRTCRRCEPDGERTRACSVVPVDRRHAITEWLREQVEAGSIRQPHLVMVGWPTRSCPGWEMVPRVDGIEMRKGSLLQHRPNASDPALPAGVYRVDEVKELGSPPVRARTICLPYEDWCSIRGDVPDPDLLGRSVLVEDGEAWILELDPDEEMTRRLNRRDAE